MKRGVLLVFAAMLLSACQQDPMINISPEVQSSIDKKLADRNRDASASEADSQTKTAEPAVTPNVDVTTWDKAPDNTSYDITRYAPNGLNQLKHFSDGVTTQLVYTDYLDQAQQLYQVRTLLADGSSDVAVYQLTRGGWQRNYQQLNTRDTLNHLSDSDRLGQSPEFILAAPVAVGTQWQDASGNSWQISALYDRGKVQDIDYQSIVEVASIQNGQAIRHYYAQDMGLVMTTHEPVDSGNQTTAQRLVLHHNQQSVSLTQTIDILTPTGESQPLLQTGQAALTWQTNQEMGQSWTQLMRAQGWLNDQVELKSVQRQGDVLQLDFTPGIVAAINQHPAGEVGVIPAMVATLANYYGVNQVKLTVNQAILLPDKLELPTNGVWQVSPEWLNRANGQ